MPTARRARSPKSRARLRGLVLQPQQDELLLADRLPLFDQDVALGDRCRSGRSLWCGPLRAAWAVASGSMSQGRAAIEPVGDRAGTGPGRVRGVVKAETEFLMSRSVRLDDPFGNDALARHQARCRPGLGRRCGWPAVELDSSLRGRASGPRTPFARSGRKRLLNLAVQIVASLGRSRWPP